MKPSVIVTTYNRPDALRICLQSLLAQNQLPADILIADDGSSKETRQLLEQMHDPNRLIKHVWQDDDGFRAGTIRNKAVAESSSSYLIFLDGDIAVFPNFIEWHIKLAEKGWFVAGNRILLSPETTATWEWCSQDAQPQSTNNPFTWSNWQWLMARFSGKVNRLMPLLKRPANHKSRKRKPTKWQGVKTCNLGIWKQDFIAVNGFDEQFQGWGHEDADLAIRLIHNGIYRKDGRFGVPALHLWHQENPRDNEARNWQRLQSHIANPDHKWAKRGLDQYL